MTIPNARDVLVLTAALTFAAAAAGQGPRFSEPPNERKSYVKIDVEPGYLKELERRLQTEGELGPLKDLVRKVLANPRQLGLDPQNLKEMKLDNPELKKALEEWLRTDPKLRESLRDFIRQNPPQKEMFKDERLRQDLEKIIDESARKEPEPARNDWKVPEKQVRPQEDALTKLTERAMKEAERTRLGKFLSDSPAWQRALQDLRGALQQPDAPAGFLSDWLAADSDTLKLADRTFDRLGDLPRPRLDRLRWDVSLPGLALPEVGSAGGGGDFGASLPNLGAAARWLIAALIVLLIGWRLWHGTKRAAPVTQRRPDLGPWPVRPEAIITRADLVAAFDYLALWTLGLAVNSWNHHAVAGRWCERSPACAASAETLARLYEQARYTRGGDFLSDAERAMARRALLQIAEAL